jgi:PAS domain S-box-containing protein
VPAPASSRTLDWNDLRALVEQVEDYAMFVLDLKGYVASWNRGAQKIKGYRAEQIIGQHFSKFYQAEDLESRKPDRELEEAMRTGHVEDEGWRVRADGTTFWAFVSITLLRDDLGTPKGFAKVTRDLTERRLAQEELRRTEERFRLLIEGISDYAIYTLDPDGIVTTWNSGAQKIKGYDASEIIGRDFSLFFTPEDRAADRPRAELATAAAQGRSAEEGWRLRADGSRFWAGVVVTAVRDPSGTLVGFSKITRDLTERKLAEDTERELREQHTARAIAEAAEHRASQERERFRLLSRQLDVILEGVVDGITVQDRSGAVIFANTAAARMTGLGSREELMATDAATLLSRFDLLDEHGRPFPIQDLPGRRVLSGDAQASALLHVRDRRTGSDWWTQIRASGVVGDDGRAELAINIWHDVTQQRRQDEQERCLSEVTAALSESLNYRATLDVLAHLLTPGFCDWCAIYLLEGENLLQATVAHADPGEKKRAEELERRYPPAPGEQGGVWQVLQSGAPVVHELVTDEMLKTSARSAEHLSMLEEAGLKSVILVPIKTRDRVVGALSLITASSGRRYDTRDLALATELGRRIGTFIENSLLFERARAAAASAEAAVREAQAAARMKDEFLATVSHELRTPLNAILGWATLLKRRSQPESMTRGIDVIHRNAMAQSKLIEDILDVSRIITGKLRLELASIDLATIVADAIEVVRPSAAAQSITLVLNRPTEPASIIGDPERLQQVMWNLLSNAVKFNDAGGHVAVKVEQRAGEWAVTVSDDGKGIELDFLPYVFDRFKQADSSTTRRFGGLGLGLAIVRHIVELHGGKVSVSSQGPGRGSTFQILLPTRAAVPAVDEGSAAEGGAAPLEGGEAGPSLAGIRVLVVDDEADALDLLELVLQESGAEVKKAGSASAGFAQLQHFRPDVIVSDVAMPDEDGYSFMRRVRAMNGAVAITPSIALTAYTRHDDKLKALAMGFTTHLGKPVNPDELRTLVAKLSERPKPAALGKRDPGPGND